MDDVVESIGDRLVASRWAELQTRLPWLQLSREPSAFVTNWGEPLIDQWVRRVAANDVDELHVSAPFFDPDVAALGELVARLRPHSIEVSIAEGAHVDGPKLYRVLERAGAPAKVLRIEPDSFVHGKLYAAVVGDQGLILAGSPNCSRSALLRAASKGNVEAGVIVLGTAADARALFVAPGTTREEMGLEAIQKLTYSISPTGAAWQYRLLRAEIHDDGGVSVAFTPTLGAPVSLQAVGGSQILPFDMTGMDEVPSFGTVQMAKTTQALTEDFSLVELVDSAGKAVSNRVALDDLARLQVALHPRELRAASERELDDPELDRDVLEILNELRSRCSFDVPTAKARRADEAALDTSTGDASFWENLGPITPKARKPTGSRRFHGRLDEEGIFAQLRAMLLQAPYVPTLRVISQHEETRERADDPEADEPDRPARSWSDQQRRRVRIRHLLMRWFRSVGNADMRSLDPEVCIANYVEMLRALERLWHGDGQTRFFDRDDLAELWLELFTALASRRNPVGLMAGVEKPMRDRLANYVKDQGADILAGLLAFDACDHIDREAKLAWQPLLEAGFAWGILDSPEPEVVNRIQEVVDFLDDPEWCRRTGERLGLKLRFKTGGLHEAFNRILEIDGADLLADVRVPQAALSCLEYRMFATLVIESKGRSDRIALKADEPAFSNIVGHVGTRAEVWLTELRQLVSDGRGLRDLSWTESPELAG
jgi:hypothetical protein